MTKELLLGSGKLYIAKHNSGDAFDLAQIAVEANQVGLIQGGATMEYTKTVYEVKDDLNIVYKRFLTGEECVLKSGILTWNVETLNSIIGDADDTQSTESKKVIKLGGLGAREMDEFAVVFVHERKNGKKIRVGMCATNDAGLTLTFAPDKETVVDAEFRAISSDDNGTLVIIEEE